MKAWKRLTAYAAAAVVLFTSGNIPEVSAANPGKSTTITVTYGQTEAREMLKLVNDLRTGDDAWAWNASNTEKEQYTNLQELKYDPVLEKAAMQRAAEIALDFPDNFAHFRPNGDLSVTALPDNHKYYRYGENIAMGSGYMGSMESIFDGWCETNENYSGQGHRRNMLSADYTAIGIGYAEVDGIHFWVQEFGSPHSGQVPDSPVDGDRTVTIELVKPCEHKNVIIDAAVAPTCTEAGLTEGSHCGDCGEVLQKQETVAAAGHSWDAGKVTTDPTCGKEGVKTYTCSTCGKTKTELIAATGNHTPVTDKAVEPTCTVRGLTEGSHCSVCGTVIEEQQMIDPLGHEWDDGTVTTEATCTGSGAVKYVCNRCGVEETVATEPTGHTPEAVPGKAATCKETGLTDGSVCSVCGVVLEKQEVIPLAGHSWDEGETLKEATCTEEGEALYTCTVCGKQEIRETDALGHTPEVVPGKEATCKETGLTDGSVCSVCGVVLENQEVIPYAEHSWDEGKVLEEPTCTEEGEALYTCTVCGKQETRGIEAAGHTAVIDPAIEPTYTEEGLTEGIHCSVCGEIIKAQVSIPKLEQTNAGEDKSNEDKSNEDKSSEDKDAAQADAVKSGSEVVETGVDESTVPVMIMLMASILAISGVVIGKRRTKK